MYLQIELTHKCNLKCSFCFRDEVKINKDMDLETCFKVLDMAKQIGIDYIRYTGFGENLLYKDFTKVLKHTTSMFKKVDFNTNATLLNDEVSEQIIKSGIDNIVFSVTGFNNDVYKNFQGKGVKYTIDDVNKNILKFIEINNKSGSTVKVYLQYIKTEDNINDLKQYIDFWESKVTDINVSYLDSVFGKLKKNNVEKRKKCGQLNKLFLIHADGDVSVCCSDYIKATKVGNIHEVDLKDILKSEKFEKICMYNETLDINFLPDICKKCDEIIDDENNNLGYLYSELKKSKEFIDKIGRKKIALWGLNGNSKLVIEAIKLYFNNEYLIVDSSKEGFYGKNEILSPNLESLKDCLVITFMENGYEEVKNYLDVNKIDHVRYKI